MRFKFVCYYRGAEELSWGKEPKIAVINAKNKADAAVKFRSKYPDRRLILVDKAF